MAGPLRQGPSPGGGRGGRGGASGVGFVHCTVSHFNLIHISCHEAAKRADAALRVPKREWEGAALRNSGTRCNNLLPVGGSAALEAAYAAAAAAFWDALPASSAARSRPAGSGAGDSVRARLGAAAADIASLLRRFAFGLSFSADAQGGGRDSNARLLPHLLRLGAYLADSAAPEDLRPHHAALAELISARGGQTAIAKAPYMLALALLLQPPEEWRTHRRAILRTCLRHVFAANNSRPASQQRAASPPPSGAAGSDEGVSNGGGAASSRAYVGEQLTITTAAGGPSASSVTAAAGPANQEVAAGGAAGAGDEGPSGTSDEALWAAAAPMVRYFGLVDLLQQALKALPAGDSWQQNLRHKLQDLEGTVEVAEQLLERLSELEEAGSPLEAFDVIGVLEDVLSVGTTSCEQFLRQCAS